MLWLKRANFGVLFLLTATCVLGQQSGDTPLSALAAPAAAANTPAVPLGPNDAIAEGKSWIDPNCAAQNGPSMLVTFEALCWRLENTQGDLIIINNNYPTPAAPVRHSNDLDLGFQVGPRIKTTWITEEGNAFQVVYTGIYNWGANDLVNVPGQTLRVPDVLGTSSGSHDYWGAQAMYVELNSKYNSVEANATFSTVDQNIIPLIGLRYLRLDEQFLLRSFKDYPGSVGPPPPFHSDYEINCKDEMWGLQGGLVYRARVRDRWEVNAWAKLGAFTNNVQQFQTVTDVDRTLVLRNASGNRWVASFLGDFSLSALYILNNNIYLKGGYDVNVMSGVARATDQIDFGVNTLSGQGVQTNFPWFAHGFNAGVEVRW